MNQAEFAVKIGVGSPSAVSYYEKEQRSPDISILVKIARLGNVELTWLVTGEGPKEKGQEQQGPGAGEARFSYEEWVWINKLLKVLRNPHTSQAIKENLTAFEKIPGGEVVEEEEKRPLKKIG